MEKKEVPIETIKLVYDIIQEIFNFEESLKKGNKHNKKEKAYLVPKNNFDDFKIYIHYQDLKKCVQDKIAYGKFKNSEKTIRKLFIFQKVNKKLDPCKFNNSRDLIIDLYKNNSQYNIININLGDKIVKKKNNSEVETISYEINGKNLKIYFNNNNSLEFKINEKNFVINISNLVLEKEKIDNIMEIQKNLPNKNENIKEDDKLISIIKKKYKKEIEILVRYIIFYKKIREKEESVLSSFEQENKERIFLINNDWMKKFKEFFEFNELASYVLEKLKKEKINFDIEEKFEEIFSNIPDEYFKKFKNKTISVIEKNIEDIEKEQYKIKTCCITFFKNFQIINNKVLGKLIELNYDVNQISPDLYIIGKNILLLRFSHQNLEKDICDELGLINGENLFINKWLLNYTNITKDISISTLNSFIKKNLSNNEENLLNPLNR